jgi:5-methylcytosine-specific restriction endonuclease McrA
MVLYRDAYRCQRCGMAANHVDHVVPVIFGGNDDESNLRALCAACNLARGAEPPAAA